MTIKQVEGLEQVIKSLKGLEPKIKLKFAKNSTKAGAMEFKNKAKANAPYAAIKRGFGVKAMVIIRTQGNKKGKDGRTKAQIKRGDDPFYWYFHERGFYSKPGRFFVTSAFEARKNQTLQAMERRIASDVSKYRGR